MSVRWQGWGTFSVDLVTAGGVAPNQVIARSEFEVHRQIYKE